MSTHKSRKYYRLNPNRNLRNQMRGKILDSRTLLHVQPAPGFLNLRYAAARSKLVLELVMRV